MKRLLICLEMIALASMAACQPPYARVQSLLITTDVFPSGWAADAEGPKPPPSAPFGGIRSIERTLLFFQSTTGSAFEEIERLSGYEETTQEFSYQKAILFQDDKEEGPYAIPFELPYKSLVADQYYFSCVRPSYYPYPYLGCFYLAQYGPYIVTFHIDWNLDAMSASELEKILRSVDARMVPYTK